MAKCLVSYTDHDGIHSVEVSAETLFEAVALAIAEFREDKTVPHQPGPMTEFSVQIIKRPVQHTIRMKRVVEWATMGNTTSPAEKLLHERVKKLLAS